MKSQFVRTNPGLIWQSALTDVVSHVYELEGDTYVDEAIAISDSARLWSSSVTLLSDNIRAAPDGGLLAVLRNGQPSQITPDDDFAVRRGSLEFDQAPLDFFVISDEVIATFDGTPPAHFLTPG
jgi:hypothetical protein